MTEEAKRCVEALQNGACCGLCQNYGLTIDRPWLCENAERANDAMFDAVSAIKSLSAQLEQTENKLSELLSYATGGRFSKADYSIDDMRRFVDDYNQSECNECDQLEYVNNKRDGLNIMLAQAQAMLETRTKERDEAVADLKLIVSGDFSCAICGHYAYDEDDESRICADCDVETYSNWQWRGVEVE